MLPAAECNFRQPYRKKNDRNVFMSDLDDHAVMNIDRVDVRLALVNYEKVTEVKKGRRPVYRYRGGGLDVQVNFKITKLCDPDDENCSIAWYDAVITVSSGSKKRSIDVKGICGS